MQDRIKSYFSTLGRMPFEAVTTAKSGGSLATADAFGRAIQMARRAHARGNKLMFIGNGGSAAIASHMAIDYTKNGNMRSLAFNDGSSLTCLGNDLGYEN